MQIESVVGGSLITADIAFGEGPRWHDGRLWLSDIFAKRVLAVGLDGCVETIATVDGHPSGLGWLPDGTMLVVSMLDRTVMRLDPGGLTVHANLSALCPGNCNDMVVDGRGNAYVGNTGYQYAFRGQHVPVRRATHLVLVRADGSAAAQPGTLMFPNGCAVNGKDLKTDIVIPALQEAAGGIEPRTDGRIKQVPEKTAVDPCAGEPSP